MSLPDQIDSNQINESVNPSNGKYVDDRFILDKI